MRYRLTQHAQKAMEEREILLPWIERTLESPELCLPDPGDPGLERRYRRIPEFGNRVLRVIVSTGEDPRSIVSVFFDRNMKGVL